MKSVTVLEESELDRVSTLLETIDTNLGELISIIDDTQINNPRVELLLTENSAYIHSLIKIFKSIC